MIQIFSWIAYKGRKKNLEMSSEGVFVVCVLLLITGVSTLRMGDILNAEYLPSTLMIEEAEIDNAAMKDNSNVSTEGRIRDAFDTMQFHRAKMNEYLCRSYIADEILSELQPKTVSRLGIPSKKIYKNHKPQESLLTDQGSSSYRDWLSRSTLLDDVYRHYDVMMDHEDSEASGTEEVESGEVTGYAVQSGGRKSPNWGPSIYGVGGGGGDFGGHGPGIGGHYQSHSPVEYPQEHHGGGDEHHYYYQEEEHGKGLAIKELFDLALTALAFLAFGLFIMNLIMTCLLGTNNGNTVVTTMMTVTASGGAAAHRGAEGRSLIDDNALNEMAYRVLTSVEELKKLYKGQPGDDRGCFRYSLCQNNKYSRSLSGSKRLWLPIWSFGLSWLIGRLGEDRLSSLQASVLGLGDADCRNIFPTCSRTHWMR
ncbi:hypothetical protein GE061_002166 [Apolygus lucorum]|uniref:Uncharacterized protein n=1 Tax=Apolygus lucorum TaxID=248454 RepID=A0A8S9X664_APOLU|nr:hypothetical protein GE061_002166 [Apolygus lucorum]